ncbi:hypothetical protein LX36DRAFT_694201 [Colletotrichum falcatum]|nr:hypothetical protein LX36DRAFT_694201 [Colletotrichum falcatum]
MPTAKIEDYRPGYPRYTALVAAHDSYFLCRRFNKVRARLLLLKQDRLVALEERLDEIDHQETSSLFLGKSRSDGNQERILLLSELDSCLADYDQLIDRTRRVLNLGPAQKRDLASLQNWMEGNGCIARAESAYLTQERDLMSLAPVGDGAVLHLEAWMEDNLIRLWRGFRKSRHHDVSNDSNIYIYSGTLIRRTARGLLLLLITVLLMLPVIICNIVNTASARIIVVMVSTICYLLVLSGLTNSRTMELVVAGATLTDLDDVRYATILTVFVSGGDEAQG